MNSRSRAQVSTAHILEPCSQVVGMGPDTCAKRAGGDLDPIQRRQHDIGDVIERCR